MTYLCNITLFYLYIISVTVTTSLTASVPSGLVTQTTPIEGELGEYVDMTTAKATLKPLKNKEKDSKKERYGNSATLAGYYSDSLPSRKAFTTVGLSTAVGTPTEFETQRNMAHVSSTESSVPVSSCDSSPRHMQSSSEMGTSPPMQGGGAVYCNILELKSKLLKSSSDPSAGSVTPPGVITPPTAQENIYSNLSQNSPRDITLPPRDIQRPLNASLSLPVGKQPLPTEPLHSVGGKQPPPTEPLHSVGSKQPPPTETLHSVGSKQPPPTQPLHSATGESEERPPPQTDTDSTQEIRDDSTPSQQDISPSVTRRPTTAPKPRSRQKPGKDITSIL